jgi:hypothetical protein
MKRQMKTHDYYANITMLSDPPFEVRSEQLAFRDSVPKRIDTPLDVVTSLSFCTSSREKVHILPLRFICAYKVVPVRPTQPCADSERDDVSFRTGSYELHASIPTDWLI